MTPETLFYFFQNKDIILLRQTILRLSWWKDNITYRASLADGRDIIIQCMRSIRNIHHASFIDDAIAFLSKKDPSLWFAPTPDGLQRFYEADWCFIQIMDVVSWKNIAESDITISIVEKLALKLWRFHKVAQDFSCEKYQDVNYHRERLHEFRLLAEKFVHLQKNTHLHDLLTEYTFRIEKLRPDPSLRKGLIHGDPVYKNFLIQNGNITAWIDYDMMSVTTELWDLADMYRAYAKILDFWKEEAKIVLEAYESENPLSIREKELLPDYIRMMCLDTWYRYILALDPKSGFYNALGDSLEKAKRCIHDHDRVGEWFTFPPA